MTFSFAYLIEVLSILVGLVIVFITYRAGKISSKKYLYFLSLGFGIISTGSLVEELISHLYEDFSIRQDHLVESIFVNFGLIIIWIALKEENVNHQINDNDIRMNSEMSLEKEELLK